MKLNKEKSRNRNGSGISLFFCAHILDNLVQDAFRIGEQLVRKLGNSPDNSVPCGAAVGQRPAKNLGNLFIAGFLLKRLASARLQPDAVDGELAAEIVRSLGMRFPFSIKLMKFRDRPRRSAISAWLRFAFFLIVAMRSFNALTSLRLNHIIVC